MKNIFDAQVVHDFKVRVQQLNHDSKGQWGKMNVYQMVKHCTENERMLLREKSFRRLFIGRLFGKMALKSNLKSDAPLSKNSPTHPDLKIKENGDLEAEKLVWLSLLDQYLQQKPSSYINFVHPFFGKMTSEQIGQFAYKHVDHHLRQFGV